MRKKIRGAMGNSEPILVFSSVISVSTHWYASPSTYNARKIKGWDTDVNSPEYSPTTWSLSDAI